MFYLTPTAESHSTACCYYGEARRLSTCVSGSKYVLCMRVCVARMMCLRKYVFGAVVHGLAQVP